MMTPSNFNLRGISPEVMAVLKREAHEKKISLNLLILQLIEQGIGYSKKAKKHVYHDLDNLAGTWSKEDNQIFEENVKSFEQIDEEFWR